MREKSLISEAKQIQLATDLIKLGARLQVLEANTELSRERLVRLYKEIKGISPPKGMLPYSEDWFTSWQPNVHSSLFINIYNFIINRKIPCMTLRLMNLSEQTLNMSNTIIKIVI